MIANKDNTLSQLELLNIPHVSNIMMNGSVYDVHSVEIFNHVPLIHIKDNDQILTFKLPNELSEWVNNVLTQGNDYLPSLIEFKYFNEQYMAQSLGLS